jgi:hypothetical protein
VMTTSMGCARLRLNEQLLARLAPRHLYSSPSSEDSIIEWSVTALVALLFENVVLSTQCI